MKSRIAGLVLALAGALAVPTPACAQKVERVVPWEVGDKAVWKWVLGAKTQQLEETFIQASETAITGVQKSGGKEFELVLALPSFAITKGVCITTGDACTFSPGIQMLEMPLEKGRRWTTSFTATGGSFSTNVVQERHVEKVESRLANSRRTGSPCAGA